MYRLTAFKGRKSGFNGLPDESEKGNLYTVLIGENGTGKSRLLGDIAQHFLKHPPSGGEPIGAFPERTLAVSNMVTDNFPYTQRVYNNYRYLGLRQASNNITTGSLGSSLGTFLIELRSSGQADTKLGPLLRELDKDGYTVSARTEIRKESSSASVEGIVSELRRLHVEVSSVVAYETYGRLKFITDSIVGEGQEAGKGRYIVDEHEIGRALSHLAYDLSLPVHILLTLLRTVFSTKFEMNLISRADPDGLATHLSAGQAMLISMVLRILATIRSNSLILIDEPEAGLHPGWQSGFISLLRSVLPDTLESHIFIATHSPYVVANADNVLVPDGAGHFTPLARDHRGMSVDDILYRVFETRIVGNAAVESDLALIVDWLSRGERTSFDPALEDAAERLNALSNSGTITVNAILAEYRARRSSR